MYLNSYKWNSVQEMEVLNLDLLAKFCTNKFKTPSMKELSMHILRIPKNTNVLLW